jgi:hemerythrin-like domain-containing protein
MEHALSAPRWRIIDEHDIVLLVAEHGEQRQLCSMLERIADELPAVPSHAMMLDVGQRLSSYAQRHFPLEARLFVRLAGQANCPTSERILKEIGHNHAIDAIHADDLAAALQRLSGSTRPAHPGELAYMLRCFFDGCRRAIAFEELALLKLGGERLTPAARRAVLRSFQAG